MPNSRRSHDIMYYPMGILSALFGWLIAVGNRLQWQAPVETAQVLAGIVRYPAGNPFLTYHLKVWSLLNQLTAIALASGVPERSASFFIEGAVGAVSFFAIFLICYAISSNQYLALLMPLFMYSFTLTGVDVAYPIALLGTDATFGVFGLALMLLVIGLLGNGHYRTGALLAGLAPACHPALGAFCVLLVMVSIYLNKAGLKQRPTRLILYFAAGSIITAVSLAWQLNLTARLPGLDPSAKRMYLDAFIQHIAYHRAKGGWTDPGVLLGLLAAVLAGLAARQKNVQTGAKIVLTSIAASVVLTMALVILSDNVPPLGFLQILIPWRFMNYANICVLPLAFGVLASPYAERFRSPRFLLIASIILCVLWQECHIPNVEFLYLAVILIPLSSLILRVRTGTASRKGGIPLHSIFVTLVILFLSYEQVLPAIRTLAAQPAVLTDRTNSTLFNAISTRPGLLLTAGNLDRIQLRTRRPVLLDGGSLDTLPYSLDSAPQFHRILKQVYGIDMFAKSSEHAVHSAAITFSHRTLWEHRSPSDWQAIRQEFGVTDILTPASWNLQLPVVTKANDLALFTIP